MPRIAARAVASVAAAAPRNSERRAPTTTCEKMSLPWSVVPKRWFHEGACPASRMLNPFGSLTEMSGAIRATTATVPSMNRPIRAFGFPSRSVSHPGSRRRPRPRATGGMAIGSSSAVGSSCDISLT